MGQGAGVLFLIAQMSQNSIDDVLVLDTRDDSDRSTAAAADFDVYVEYSLESLSLGHRDVPFSGWFPPLRISTKGNSPIIKFIVSPKVIKWSQTARTRS